MIRASNNPVMSADAFAVGGSGGRSAAGRRARHLLLQPRSVSARRQPRASKTGPIRK